MKTSPRGRGLIERSEGLELTAYRCPAGVWTIGYGHTSAGGAPQVFPGMTITKEQADAILAADLVKVERGVKRLVTAELTQNEFDALVSFTYNVGLGNLKASTLLRKLNAGRKAEVPAEFLKWNKARVHGVLKPVPGLTTRRHLEASLWDGAFQSDAKLPQRVAVPKIVAKPVTSHAAAAGLGAAGAALAPVLPGALAHVPHLPLDWGLAIPVGVFVALILGKYLWDKHAQRVPLLHPE